MMYWVDVGLADLLKRNDASLEAHQIIFGKLIPSSKTFQMRKSLYCKTIDNKSLFGSKINRLFLIRLVQRDTCFHFLE